MSKDSKKSIGFGFAAIIVALLMIASCVAGVIAVNTQAGVSNAVASAYDAASKTVTSFADSAVRADADFSENLFKKVSTAAMLYQGKNDEGQLESIATAVGADAIVITDAKGKITDAYPDDSIKGKTLKENGMGSFMKITRGVVDKMMSDPEKKDDSYVVNVAVRRQDSDGVLAITVTDDSYANVTGENLAKSCGSNVVIEKDGKILSTSFAPAEGKESLEAIGVKSKGESTLSADGKTYDVKTGEVDEYTVMVAAEAQGSSSMPMIIIIAANAALLVIGIIILAVGAKKK